MNRDLCAVCGDHIRSQRPNAAGTPQPDNVCDSFECRRILAQAATMDPSIVERYLSLQRQRLTTSREARALAKRRMDEKIAKEALESQTILEYALNKNRELSVDELGTVTIPSGSSKTSRLHESRIQAYKRHLETVIKASRNVHMSDPNENSERSGRKSSEEIFEDAPLLRIISDRMCGMCKGGCCTAGGDSAYITPSTIRRFLDTHPDSSDSDILEEYLSRLSPDTVIEACINQSSTGCVLPRSMRSDTCNEYYCKALEEWHEHAASGETDAVLVIQRADSDWGRSGAEKKNSVVDIVIIKTTDDSVVRYDPAILKTLQHQ
jgi:hypothetical protein